jgi:murein L,D-transpeptidase YcbB/YkuD
LMVSLKIIVFSQFALYLHDRPPQISFPRRSK